MSEQSLPVIVALWVGVFVQALIVFNYTRGASQRAQELAQLYSELADTWRVLHECAKVLYVRDDFDSRHVVGLIEDLGAKYPPRRTRPTP